MVDVAKKDTASLRQASPPSAESVEGIFNSRGVSDWYEHTLAEVSITMLGDNSSGWQKANSADAATCSIPSGWRRSLPRRQSRPEPRDLPPGKYTVILEPAAVLDTVGFMFWDFGGSALLEQRSFLNDRIGTQLFGENITSGTMCTIRCRPVVPFDGEGMGRHRLKLIENGVVQRVTYSRSSAKRMYGRRSASKVGPVSPPGHGFALPSEIGEAPLNIVFDAPRTANRERWSR